MKILNFSGVGAVVFVAAFATVFHLRNGTDDPAPPRYEEVEGDETVLLFIISPSCSACNDPRLPEAWTRVREMFQEQVHEGQRVTATAVVLSETPLDGLSFSQRFGDFEEVIAGRRWQNSGLIRYVYGQFRGPGSIPQIVVMTRTIYYDDHSIPVIRNERVVQRRYGLRSIFNWVGM